MKLLAAPVANLKSARTLALDDDFAVQRAQFDLANVATRGIVGLIQLKYFRAPTRVVALLILPLILASPALASEPKFPQLTGRVVDDAGVLDTWTQSELTDMLASHEGASGEQVVVVTLPSLQGYTIEEYGYQLGRQWGIGQKGKNNGALLIVAPKEHKVRIEVGYGLEGELTDAISATIIQNYILPSFKRGDYDAGVLAGTTEILLALGGNPLSAAPVSHPAANSTDAFGLIAQEAAPSRGSRTSPSQHVLRDGRLADFDAELEQLAVDPGCTPQRVGAGSSAESGHESRGPLRAAQISNANAKTSGSPDGAIGLPSLA
jgi:hypothetical protein